MYFEKLGRVSVVVLSIVLLIGFICSGLFTSISQTRRISAQNEAKNDNQKSRNTDVGRENMIFKNLSTLLLNKEVVLDETRVLPNLVETSKTMRVGFAPTEKSSPEGRFSEQVSKTYLLKQSDLKVGNQPLMRQRAFELSPTQILVVSVDGEKRVLWWNLQPDPRIFRAETSDDQGNLSGKTVYLNDAEMLVNFPAAAEIKQLYFYSPIWDGKTYGLEIVGSLNLPAQGQPE